MCLYVHSDGTYTLEHYSDDGIEEDRGLCLTRYFSFGSLSNIGLVDCHKNTAALWDFSYPSGQLSNGNLFKRCIVRDGNTAIAKSCKEGYTSLTPVLHDIPVQ